MKILCKNLLLTSALIMAGCSTITDASRIKHVPSVTLVSKKTNTSDPRITFSVQDWVQDLANARAKKCPSYTPQSNTSNSITRQTEFGSQFCFDSLFSSSQEHEKRNSRNDFIMHAMTVSDNNCRARIDRVFSVDSGGETFFGTMIEVLGIAGSAVTDIDSSRALSGATAVGAALWTNTKQNFLAGAQLQTVVTSLNEKRSELKTDIESKIKGAETSNGKVTHTPYDDYRLSEAVRDMLEYDDACDLFN